MGIRLGEDKNVDINERGKQLANEHVDWFLKTLEPLLKMHMAHGYKHGCQDSAKNAQDEQNGAVDAKQGENPYQGVGIRSGGSP